MRSRSSRRSPAAPEFVVPRPAKASSLPSHRGAGPAKLQEPVNLREPQIRRYARHILLPDVGGVGQARLLAAAARLTVGPERPASAAALAYLAAAGVGTLVIAAGEQGPITELEVEGNIVLGVGDVGRDRFEALRERLAALNPDVHTVGDPGARSDVYDVLIDAEPASGDVAAALVAGGTAAVRALVALTRES